MDKKVIKHFQRVDPIFFSLVRIIKIDPLSPRKPSQYFASLCSEIIGQQLSGRVADVLEARFKQLFPQKRVVPSIALTLSEKQLRATGMSWSKARFIKDLAQKIVNKQLDFHRLSTLTNSEVIEEITKVKGIGPWTAEMFLMFTLGREDIFSFGDLGLRKAIKKLYKLRKDPSAKKLHEISKKWSPYRTYAARILWRSLEL